MFSQPMLLWGSTEKGIFTLSFTCITAMYLDNGPFIPMTAFPGDQCSNPITMQLTGGG